MNLSGEKRVWFPGATHRRSWWALAGVLICVAACGEGQPTPDAGAPTDPGRGGGQVAEGVQLGSHAYPVALGQSVTVAARVTGTTREVTWVLNCESGQASILASGNSATITGVAGGMCFVWATEGQVSDYAIVRVLPLGVGDSCSDNSECSAAAPLCATSGCGPTCTLACSTADDCPLADAFGRHVPCTHGRCHLVRDPDWSCE
jgi:hypothetical protein